MKDNFMAFLICYVILGPKWSNTTFVYLLEVTSALNHRSCM